MGRFDRCWSVIQPTLGTSVAIRTTIEGRIRDQGRAIGISSRPLCALVRVFYNAYMSGSVGLLHARGGLCGCLRLQDEHEAPREEDQKHGWSESEIEEAKYQVAEPENEPAHVSCPSSA
ncbi:uncharacterized protein METZ01_LOCUS273152 [marine metagenome]|uniref:Uncharacterized protein n=1 Tax=marine metagenome TaxID=408172 RepID=A0A382K7J6_9ZZZZ